MASGDPGLAKKQWNSSAVASDDYLSSLTRRLEVLEKKLIGKRAVKDQPPLKPTIQVLSPNFNLPYTSTIKEREREGRGGRGEA